MSDIAAWDEKYRTDSEEVRSRLVGIEQGLVSSTLQEVMRFKSNEGARVLEIGCGTGQHAVAVARARPMWRVSAVDSSPNAIRETKALALAAGVTLDADVADITTLPYNSGEFDIVFGDHVIGHVPDLDIVLTECARVLAPGGVFIANAGNALRPDGWPLHQLVSDKAYLQRSFFPWQLATGVRRARLKPLASYGSLVFLKRGWTLILNKFQRTRKVAPSGVVKGKALKGTSRSLRAVLDRILPSFLKVEYGIIARKPS